MISNYHKRATCALCIERVVSRTANEQTHILHKLISISVIRRLVTEVNILHKQYCMHKHLFGEIDRYS